MAYVYFMYQTVHVGQTNDRSQTKNVRYCNVLVLAYQLNCCQSGKRCCNSSLSTGMITRHTSRIGLMMHQLQSLTRCNHQRRLSLLQTFLSSSPIFFFLTSTFLFHYFPLLRFSPGGLFPKSSYRRSGGTVSFFRGLGRSHMRRRF